jgi:hypothetical protein
LNSRRELKEPEPEPEAEPALVATARTLSGGRLFCQGSEE